VSCATVLLGALRALCSRQKRRFQEMMLMMRKRNGSTRITTWTFGVEPLAPRRGPIH
jgi:hypothetical protein